MNDKRHKRLNDKNLSSLNKTEAELDNFFEKAGFAQNKIDDLKQSLFAFEQTINVEKLSEMDVHFLMQIKGISNEAAKQIALQSTREKYARDPELKKEMLKPHKYILFGKE